MPSRLPHRAVFKLINGKYIRAYGSVFFHKDQKMFCGVCIPASIEEYIGRPFLTQNISQVQNIK
ncbi:MAG: hypothetical protein V4555_02745 [Acidobacteriota bacterium]